MEPVSLGSRCTSHLSQIAASNLLAGTQKPFMHFRAIKDLIALPLHWMAGRPECVARATLGTIGALARTAYFVPGSHVRQTVADFCRVTDRSDPWRIYSIMVRNLQQAGLYYASLKRNGRSELLANTIIDASLATQYSRLRQTAGGSIFLVPHCAAAVLSSARLSTFCPTVLLVREPRSPTRQALMMNYLEFLGVEFILTRMVPPATVVRNILRALQDNKVIVGTTDVIHPAPDTVETWAFGQRICSPAWPAKIAARLGVPILPGFIHLEGPQIRLLADEGYLASDVQQSTQRWMSSFERWFRRYPSDWVFMLDKRWARVLAAAAQAARWPQPMVVDGKASPPTAGLPSVTNRLLDRA
jgi:lauroyl/myristoyl acyltransferase